VNEEAQAHWGREGGLLRQKQTKVKYITLYFMSSYKNIFSFYEHKTWYLLWDSQW